MKNPQVIIIGGGLAGLTAALSMQQQQRPFLLLEATDRIGGRIKTDVVDGFRLDHGFQVFLPAYPEGKKWLNYHELSFKSFDPGSFIKKEGKTLKIGDPFFDWGYLFPTLFSGVGTLGDLFGVITLKYRLANSSVDEIFQQRELPTSDVLSAEYGFSTKIIETFLQPFFAGIFLEQGLTTSRRMFDFVFKMMSESSVSIPEFGMEEIPKQLAARLPSESIKCNAKVVEIDGTSVRLEDGTLLSGDTILIATDQPSGLRGEAQTMSSNSWIGVDTLYFSSSKPIYEDRLITLNANNNRFINNIAPLSTISRAYAPEGKHLYSISILDQAQLSDEEMVTLAKKELVMLFGSVVEEWTFLKRYAIPYALPHQSKVSSSSNWKLAENLYSTGDFHLYGSANGAMKAGADAARAILTSM